MEKIVSGILSIGTGLLNLFIGGYACYIGVNLYGIMCGIMVEIIEYGFEI